MTLREKQALFIVMEAKLILEAERLNTPIVRIEWMRSVETQRLMVARGASKTMNSKHLEGLASDFCFLADVLDDGKLNFNVEKYRQLGEYWEILGGRWGGRFGQPKRNRDAPFGWDAGHFEYGG